MTEVRCGVCGSIEVVAAVDDSIRGQRPTPYVCAEHMPPKPFVFTVYCSSGHDTREARRYGWTEAKGWQLDVLRLIPGGKRDRHTGVAEWYVPTPEWLAEAHSDNPEWSRKLTCPCGQNLPIREVELFAYLDTLRAAGQDRIELVELKKLHQRRATRRTH